MSTPVFDTPSQEAITVLKLLRRHHNVLISGPPATGKSRLLAEVRHWFRQVPTPSSDPAGEVAFPPTAEIVDIEEWMPSPERLDRKVFPITFHQGTKYRDFVYGVVPDISGGGTGFKLTYGPLVEAANFGKAENGASLIEVDEINRGPAVAVFGDTITAIEGDKRLKPDGEEGPLTATFRLLASDGTYCDYALPDHLYILAAMNEADTSVEPLDVAFLRRFEKHRLLPSEPSLRLYFGLPPGDGADLPTILTEAAHVFEAAVRAWVKINDRIAFARGSALQIGHGIFMPEEKSDLPGDKDAALAYVTSAWGRLFTHVEEVFFGDTRTIAAVLRAGEPGNPYFVEQRTFADSQLMRLRSPEVIAPSQIYPLLLAVAGGE